MYQLYTLQSNFVVQENQLGLVKKKKKKKNGNRVRRVKFLVNIKERRPPVSFGKRLLKSLDRLLGIEIWIFAAR